MLHLIFMELYETKWKENLMKICWTRNYLCRWQSKGLMSIYQDVQIRSKDRALNTSFEVDYFSDIYQNNRIK